MGDSMLGKKEIRMRFGNFINDNRAVGPMLIIGLVLVIAVMGFMALLFLMVLLNLETIGRGIMYFAVALLIMVGVAVVAKRFLFTGKWKGVSR